MIDQASVPSLMGSIVRDGAGEKIGKVGQVYLDDTTGQPEWVTVKTGLFGTKENFVPLAAARVEGDELVVDIPKAKVTDAPKLDEDGHLTEAQETELYSYYGVSQGAFGRQSGPTDSTYATTDTATGYDSGTTTDTSYATGGLDTDRTAGVAAGTAGGESYRTGRDTSGPETDDAMTRSEEHLVAGTDQVETGRARLRKYVVTDTETVHVPVSREEVTLEREPVTDSNAGAAYSGGDITEEEHEVTLRAERPVVTTETEAVERVRLGKETVTDTETVSGEVRKEEIELDDQTRTTRDS